MLQARCDHEVTPWNGYHVGGLFGEGEGDTEAASDGGRGRGDRSNEAFYQGT